MNDRIHAWLDGELTLDELTPDERRMAERTTSWMDTVREQQEASAPAMGEAVMATVGSGEPDRSRPRHRPHPRPRPLGRAIPVTYAVAAGLMCLVLGWAAGAGFGASQADMDSGLDGASGGDTSSAAHTGPAEAGAPLVYVRFDVSVDDARSVHLAGSFSDWEPRVALSPAGDGRWTAVVPLAPGVHDYVYVVDGERHLLDPAAPRIADGFGSFSSRLALLTTDA